jgi:YesN/AraC family two-component response regulator
MKEVIARVADKKFLIVEDDDYILKLLVDTFQVATNSNTIYSAHNGEDGYNKYLDIQPDIIITDLRMPKMNGSEMIEKIRKKDTNVPVIVLSAFVEELENPSHVNAVVQKPVDFQNLILKIDQLTSI